MPAKRAKQIAGGRKPVTTKIPDDLRSLLVAAAEASGRTFSAEIEHRLYRSFVADDVRDVVREELARRFDPPPLSVNVHSIGAYQQPYRACGGSPNFCPHTVCGCYPVHPGNLDFSALRAGT